MDANKRMISASFSTYIDYYIILTISFAYYHDSFIALNIYQETRFIKLALCKLAHNDKRCPRAKTIHERLDGV